MLIRSKLVIKISLSARELSYPVWKIRHNLLDSIGSHLDLLFTPTGHVGVASKEARARSEWVSGHRSK